MVELDAARAALNSAHWCDAMARAQGVPGEWSAGWWMQPRPAPRYYPNAANLRPALTLAEVSLALAPLRAAGLAGAWGLKDSFADLPLDRLGFTRLFEAQWLGWTPDALAGLPPGPDLHWLPVRDAEALRAWEAAWWQADGDLGAAATTCQFPPALLADGSTQLLGGWRAGRLVAGVIGHHAAGVTGLGNLFGLDADLDAARPPLWGSALRAVAAAWPGVPLVGYERDASLAAALACGARALGPLRVWLSGA